MEAQTWGSLMAKPVAVTELGTQHKKDYVVPRSQCCGASVKVAGGPTTHWWQCSCCGQPTDTEPVIGPQVQGNIGKAPLPQL